MKRELLICPDCERMYKVSQVKIDECGNDKCKSCHDNNDLNKGLLMSTKEYFEFMK